MFSVYNNLSLVGIFLMGFCLKFVNVGNLALRFFKPPEGFYNEHATVKFNQKGT